MTEPEEEEKFSDTFDTASHQEMRFTAAAIAAVQARLKREQEPDEEGNYVILDCVECGNEIGQGRLAVAARNTVCVFCASKAERRK